MAAITVRIKKKTVTTKKTNLSMSMRTKDKTATVKMKD